MNQRSGITKVSSLVMFSRSYGSGVMTLITRDQWIDCFYTVVGTVTEESNDYFDTHYWTLKKVTITSLLVTGP
jgi:hypothetical protein